MKKTNLFISLACALVLVATMAAPNMVAAEEHEVGATVTINEYISSSISGSIDFGSLDPGATDVVPAGQDDDTPVVIVTVEAETNVDCDITILGSGPFSDGGTNSFLLANAKWNNSNALGTATAMDDIVDGLIGQFTDPDHGTAVDFDVWHWISIPNGQTAAIYNTNFLYTVDKTP